MEKWEALLNERLANHQIILNDQQLNQFAKYADLLIEWNQKMNLTAIDSIEEIYEKHFYDCLLSSFDIDYHGSLADVGSGAGFPGVVLKIVYPQLQLSIIEPLGKRCTFLKVLCETLGLSDVTIINERSEDYARDHREGFDFVTARAVANLSMLVELCGALVAKGGYFIALKGEQGEVEAKAAQQAVKLMGLKLVNTALRTYSGNMRVNLIYLKEKVTPAKYPRSFAKIKKQHLGE